MTAAEHRPHAQVDAIARCGAVCVPTTRSVGSSPHSSSACAAALAMVFLTCIAIFLGQNSSCTSASRQYKPRVMLATIRSFFGLTGSPFTFTTARAASPRLAAGNRGAAGITPSSGLTSGTGAVQSGLARRAEARQGSRRRLAASHMASRGGAFLILLGNFGTRVHVHTWGNKQVGSETT